MVELQSVGGGRPRGRRHRYGLSDQCRGQEHKAVRPVDVVLDHRVVENGDAHQLDVGPEPGGHPRGPKGRQRLLGVGVKAQGHDISETHAEEPGRVGGHHYLVGIIRGGLPTLQDARTVLIEETAVRARQDQEVVQRVQAGGAVRGQWHEVQRHEVPDPFHTREASDPRRQWGHCTTGGVRRVDRDRHVGRICARQEGRVRGLRTPPPGDRCHSDPADQADEQHHAQVAAPATGKGGPEAVPGNRKDLAHSPKDL